VTRRQYHSDPDEPIDAKASWRYGSKLVDMLDEVSWSVGNVPHEMQMPRESIQHLLKAAYYLLEVKEGLVETQHPYFIRSAARELQKGIGPLGLGVDYWAKISEWRERDIKEVGPTDFLVVDWVNGRVAASVFERDRSWPGVAGAPMGNFLELRYQAAP
jgi:hypothetical protein